MTLGKLFLPFFTLYTLAAAGLLALGLVPYFATVSPSFHAVLHGWSLGQGLLAQAIAAILTPAHNHVISGTWSVTSDYFFSILNLALGVFLVWRRPDDWLARLLGIGMVGTGLVTICTPTRPSSRCSQSFRR